MRALHSHEGRVGGGILGLVSADGLEVSRVGNDDGAGAVGASVNTRQVGCENSGERVERETWRSTSGYRMWSAQCSAVGATAGSRFEGVKSGSHFVVGGRYGG